jgi:hypothetical protein
MYARMHTDKVSTYVYACMNGFGRRGQGGFGGICLLADGNFSRVGLKFSAQVPRNDDVAYLTEK